MDKEKNGEIQMSRCDFRLTPTYCLYNGAAVFEQDGVNIKFLVENKEDTVLQGRLERAFMNYVAGMLKIKDCPEKFRNLPKIEFVQGTRRQLRNCVSQLYKAGGCEHSGNCQPCSTAIRRSI